MLNEHEQRRWDEIERHYRAETGREGRRRDRMDLPAPIIGGAWGAVLLVVFGVPAAGAAIAVVTGLMWVLWRFLPHLPERNGRRRRGRRGIASIPGRHPLEHVPT